MLDVTKYVGGLTDANGKVKTDAYAEMSKDILDLSTQIPYTAKELTRLAAAAGQSGKSMDDLISGGFLKDVAEMGTAMDISADPGRRLGSKVGSCIQHEPRSGHGAGRPD